MENDDIISIFGMVDKDIVQKLQDFLASTLDFAFLCIYHDIYLTQLSGETDFCRMINGNNCEICDKCHRDVADKALYENKTIIKECPLGLTLFSIPISINGKYMLSVVGGQVLTEPLNENKFRQQAKTFGINPDEYLLEIKKIKVIEPKKLESLTELLKIMADLLAAVSYSNYHLAELGVDYRIPTNVALKEWYAQSYCNKDKPLSSRERDVLKLVLLGKSNTEIAEELFISVHTAKSHVSSILEKCKVQDRVQLAVKTVREGLL